MLQDFSWMDRKIFRADYNTSLQGFSHSCVLEHSTETIIQLVYSDIYTDTENRYPFTLKHDTLERGSAYRKISIRT